MRNDGTRIKKTQVKVRIVQRTYVCFVVQKDIDKILTMTNPNGDVYADCKILKPIVSTSSTRLLHS